MDESFRTKLDSKLAEYREWSHARNFDGCRLVQYCGVERVGVADLAMNEVESHIRGLLSEGFYVNWTDSDGRLYLRVWEFDGPEPPWPRVFAEEHLADINELLREAGGAA